MTLTLNISDDTEKKLRDRAAAEGKEASQYAAELVERAMAVPTRQYARPTAEERARIQAAVRKHLQKAQEICRPR